MYKWTSSDRLARVGGTNIHQGETFEPTEAEKRAFAERMEELSTEADHESTSEQSGESERRDYSELDYDELRTLAVEADTDEINGRSSKDDIIAYFEE